MIFTAFGRAVAQLGDPRFVRVVGVGIVLALALLYGVYALFLGLIEWAVPGSITLPVIGPIGGIDTLLGWASLFFMLVLSIFLMMPVAALFSSLFLEDVAQAVEDRHYRDLPAVTPVSVWSGLREAINFFGLLLAVNAAALLAFGIVGPLSPVVFWGINGFLLGREYFTLVAMRRLGRDGARALRARHWGKVWLAGTLMAAPLTIPLVNLIIPVLGVATFTHLFHRLNRPEPAGSEFSAKIPPTRR